jgi:hypothetical protein
MNLDKVFLLHYVFDTYRLHFIHIEVMSYLSNGRYLEDWITIEHANNACKMHYTFILEKLILSNIYPDTCYANYAVGYNYTDIVDILLQHHQTFTYEGVDKAAAEGHLDMIQKMRLHNIHCSSGGANNALINNKFNIYYDLSQHNILCNNYAIKYSLIQNNMYALKLLVISGFKPNSDDLDIVASLGYLDIIKFCYIKCNVQCSYIGIKYALENNHHDIVKFIKEY